MASKAARSKFSGGHGGSSSSHGSASRTKVCTGRARMYSALTWSSFCTSKKAGDGFTSSSRNSVTISATGQDLPAVGRAPPEQGQVVAHGLGQVAPLPELLQGHVVPALGQLLALLVDDHRQVAVEGVVGGVVAEGVAQEEDLGGGREQVLAPQDVGDAACRRRRPRWPG